MSEKFMIHVRHVISSKRLQHPEPICGNNNKYPRDIMEANAGRYNGYNP